MQRLAGVMPSRTHARYVPFGIAPLGYACLRAEDGAAIIRARMVCRIATRSTYAVETSEHCGVEMGRHGAYYYAITPSYIHQRQ